MIRVIKNGLDIHTSIPSVRISMLPQDEKGHGLNSKFIPLTPNAKKTIQFCSCQFWTTFNICWLTREGGGAGVLPYRKIRRQKKEKEINNISLSSLER